MSDPFEFDFTPAPPDAADRLSTELIEEGLAAHMDVDELDALRDGRLRWSLEGFDEAGLGRVTLTTTDGVVLATVEVHWSAICRTGDA